MGNSLLKRSVSGLIYAALIVGCILGGTFWVQCLSSLFAVLAGIELTKITIGFSRRRMDALIIDILALLVLAYGPSLALVPGWISLIIIRIIAELYINDPNPLRSLGVSLAMQVYIGLPCFLMSTVAFMADCELIKETFLLALFIMIWINDTGAFLVGSQFGKRRLFERLSPKKSVEGFVGGLVFNIAAGAIFCTYCSSFFGMPANYAAWIGLAVLVTLFATWGDLAESMIKRALDIKDSGHLIPGHGGILDRIDSFLLVMPAAAVYIYFMLC